MRQLHSIGLAAFLMAASAASAQTAAPAPARSPASNPARPAAATAGVTVWNYEVLGDAYRFSDPGPVAPITIAGVRNGTFSGAVAVGSAKPIAGLRASVGALSKDGVSIPAGQVVVRYAVSWGMIQGGPVGLDILLESPPAEVAVAKGRALAGVWVTVTVPEDASAGLYRGELTIEAKDLPPRKVPIELDVSDWRVPNCQASSIAVRNPMATWRIVSLWPKCPSDHVKSPVLGTRPSRTIIAPMAASSSSPGRDLSGLPSITGSSPKTNAAASAVAGTNSPPGAISAAAAQRAEADHTMARPWSA